MSKHSFLKYDYKTRWISYWHQINEVLSLAPKKVLEVGIGNKTVLNYLKNQGIKVLTLDIDEKLEPDIVGNVLKIPFQDNSFDVILCAEVLEHLPFEEFDKALEELERVSKKYVVLSLPHFGHSIKLSFKIKHHFDGEHYWEIGKKGYPLTKIKRIIKKHFTVKKEFIPFENQYHHFFILEKL